MVNIQTMENHLFLMSKSRIFDRAIFNSYVKLPEGNVNPGLINPAVELGGYHKKKVSDNDYWRSTPQLINHGPWFINPGLTC